MYAYKKYMFYDNFHITKCNYWFGFFALQSQNKHIGQICRSVNAIYSDAIFEFAKLKQKATV